MSSRKEVIVVMTKEQREEIRERLNQEVTHVKLWVVPGAVIFAEPLNLPESLDGRC